MITTMTELSWIIYNIVNSKFVVTKDSLVVLYGSIRHALQIRIYLRINIIHFKGNVLRMCV
jgi:hypothetical protein